MTAFALLQQHGDFLFRDELETAVLLHPVDLFEFLDRFADGFEVREHAAKPALIHIGHTAELRGGLQGLLGLFLGADEENVLPFRGNLLDEPEGFLETAESNLEINDINAVTLPENILLHLGVPALGLMPEMDSGFE